MKAINQYVVVSKIKNVDKKIGGLVITAATDTEGAVSRGRVVSAPDVYDQLEEGFVVRYLTNGGWDIDHEGEVYRVLRLSDVLLVE